MARHILLVHARSTLINLVKHNETDAVLICSTCKQEVIFRVRNKPVRPPSGQAVFAGF
jgi:hypothetical protein